MALNVSRADSRSARWSSARWNGRVGRQEAEHRGHVRLDHARALCRAADHERAATRLHRDRALLRKRVGRHDGARRLAALPAGERRHGGVNAGDDLVHLQVDADDARRGDEHVLGAASEAGGHFGGHAIGVAHALDAGAGIGASAVHDDGAGDAVAPFEMALRDETPARPAPGSS